MDAYAFVLDRLKEGDCARLRAYRDDGRTQFTTWLVVVARRLCLDWQRGRYGRIRNASSSAVATRARRRLEDLLAEAVDPSTLAAESESSPDHHLERQELLAALSVATARLSPRDRLLLALRFEEDQSAAGIARLMGFPTPFHVYRRLNALLLELRRDLERRGIDDSLG